MQLVTFCIAETPVYTCTVCLKIKNKNKLSDSLFLINFSEFEKWKAISRRILKNTDDLGAK